MNKQKRLKNQKRQQRREAKKRTRHKRPYTINIRKPKLQSYQPQQTVSLWKRVIRYLITIKNKTMCFLGIHKWTLCSGLEGTPKYMCRRCLEESKKMW